MRAEESWDAGPPFAPGRPTGMHGQATYPASARAPGTAPGTPVETRRLKPASDGRKRRSEADAASTNGALWVSRIAAVDAAYFHNTPKQRAVQGSPVASGAGYRFRKTAGHEHSAGSCGAFDCGTQSPLISQRRSIANVRQRECIERRRGVLEEFRGIGADEVDGRNKVTVLRRCSAKQQSRGVRIAPIGVAAPASPEALPDALPEISRQGVDKRTGIKEPEHARGQQCIDESAPHWRIEPAIPIFGLLGPV